MKKVGLVVLAVFSVFAIVLTAGCINENNPAQQGGSDNPALQIVIEKTGITYNIGDTMEVVLPSNPTTGYSWVIKSNDDGIKVTEGVFEQGDSSESVVGVGGYQKFIVEGLKEGEYAFTLDYKRANEDACIYEYTDILHVKKTDEEKMTPRSVFKFIGNEYTVSIGDKVTLSIAGNPTTGYQWVAQETEGLTVSEEYKHNDAPEGMAGVGGVYTWTITSDTPGAYYFTAYYQRSWEPEDPASRIIVPICFTME